MTNLHRKGSKLAGEKFATFSIGPPAYTFYMLDQHRALFVVQFSTLSMVFA
jgi:hypothetical protein